MGTIFFSSRITVLSGSHCGRCRTTLPRCWQHSCPAGHRRSRHHPGGGRERAAAPNFVLALACDCEVRARIRAACLSRGGSVDASTSTTDSKRVSSLSDEFIRLMLVARHWMQLLSLLLSPPPGLPPAFVQAGACRDDVLVLNLAQVDFLDGKITTRVEPVQDSFESPPEEELFARPRRDDEKADRSRRRCADQQATLDVAVGQRWLRRDPCPRRTAPLPERLLLLGRPRPFGRPRCLRRRRNRPSDQSPPEPVESPEEQD